MDCGIWVVTVAPDFPGSRSFRVGDHHCESVWPATGHACRPRPYGSSNSPATRANFYVDQSHAIHAGQRDDTEGVHGGLAQDFRVKQLRARDSFFLRWQLRDVMGSFFLCGVLTPVLLARSVNSSRCIC